MKRDNRATASMFAVLSVHILKRKKETIDDDIKNSTETVIFPARFLALYDIVKKLCYEISC